MSCPLAWVVATKLIQPGSRPLEIALLLVLVSAPPVGVTTVRVQQRDLPVLLAQQVATLRRYHGAALSISLFLSANEEDVRQAILAGYPAGQVLESRHVDAEDDQELRVAFDFDGVLARDLESKNGFVVNERVVRERRLRDRDELVIEAVQLAAAETGGGAFARAGSLEQLVDVAAGRAHDEFLERRLREGRPQRRRFHQPVRKKSSS